MELRLKVDEPDMAAAHEAEITLGEGERVDYCAAYEALEPWWPVILAGAGPFAWAVSIAHRIMARIHQSRCKEGNTPKAAAGDAEPAAAK